MDMEQTNLVYLDVCALSRPFDDQNQMRIQLETNAVNLILAHIRQNKLTLIISPVHEAEIQVISDREERTQLQILLRNLGKIPQIDLMLARKRAELFSGQGIGVADAAHLAFAEQARADFVTVDDRFLKKTKRFMLPIWTGSPLAFCEKENLR